MVSTCSIFDLWETKANDYLWKQTHKTVYFLNPSLNPKFSIPNSPQSQDIRQNSGRGISNFWISGHSLIKENRYNSRTSDDIDMKLGQETKLEKINKTMSKTIDNDIISWNGEVTVIFLIYGQFGAIQKPDSICIICKTDIFINSNLLSNKNWK